jgi:nucleotide-binding universal stress UspA family protein
MFRHIAIAVDFSPATEAMLRCLPGLRELGARELTFIHVARLESPIVGWVTHLEYYERKLEEMRPALERDGFVVQIAVVAGKPADEIVRIAEERNASLVLVGSRGSSSQRGGFVGSAAWEVVQRSSVPVLVQRVEPETEEPDAPFAAACCDLRSHVIYPSDFSDAAEVAFGYVEAFARTGVASFTLLHIEEEAENAEQRRRVVEDDRRRLQALADRLYSAGASRVDLEVPSGDPVDELLRLAGLRKNSLVVLGTHGRGWLAELLVGSVSHDIVRRANASVLLVRVRGDAG